MLVGICKKQVTSIAQVLTSSLCYTPDCSVDNCRSPKPCPVRTVKLLLLVGLLGLLAANGCTQSPPPVTEAQLLGTWRNVKRLPEKLPPIPANQVFIRRAGNELCFYSERGLAFLDLLPGGDSISLQQRCFLYKHAVSFQPARPGSQDTLVVERFGKYTRVDTATFFTTWRARAAALREQQRVFELQHARVNEADPVAAQERD